MPDPTEAADTTETWGLFERFGVELEYMIVRRDSLAVAPIADRLLAPDADEPEAEIEVAGVAWSNELVLHVLEMKTPDGPATSLDGLIDVFDAGVREADHRLQPDARLLPSGMHPFMDPLTETRLWPHEFSPVYRAFDRIFDCRGHGWSNVQSAHLQIAQGRTMTTAARDEARAAYVRRAFEGPPSGPMPDPSDPHDGKDDR